MQGSPRRGNPAAGIDPVEMGIGMIEGVALSANYGVFRPPAGAIIKQRIQVIVAYIEARPRRMHGDFRVLAVEAMQKPGRAKIERWRCHYPAAGVPGALGRAPRRLCGVDGRDCPTRASMQPEARSMAQP